MTSPTRRRCSRRRRRRSLRIEATLLLLLGACPLAVTPPQPATAVATAPAPERRVLHVDPQGRDDAPGTVDQPWATPQHAARVARAGDRVVLHGGEYRLSTAVRPRRSGTADRWIEYIAAPGEDVVLDASDLAVSPPSDAQPSPQDQGAFHIEGVAYVRVRGLTIRNSHQAGFVVRDSHHVALEGNTTRSTFGSGIAAWDSDHDDRGAEFIEIVGNTVVGANRASLAPPWEPEGSEPPHEAISLGGVQYFEVARNHVHHCDKEGIDIKETSKHGRVHGNHVHHVARQGLYVDSWFGDLLDVELDHNEVHHCVGAGVVVSVEGGRSVRDVRIHHNVIRDNLGTGVFFSRWGDGPRHQVVVAHNTIHHNGHGPPKPGEDHYWLTGGIYLYSANLSQLRIHHNIISDNRAFQIGVSEHYLADGSTLEHALAQREISIAHNWVHPTEDPASPVRVGWPPDDLAWVHPVVGHHAQRGAVPTLMRTVPSHDHPTSRPETRSRPAAARSGRE